MKSCWWFLLRVVSLFVLSLLSKGSIETKRATTFMKSRRRLLLGFVVLFVFSLRSKGQFDFMKFVTRVAFRNQPGNKFHEITMVFFAKCCFLVRVLVAFERPS